MNLKVKVASLVLMLSLLMLSVDGVGVTPVSAGGYCDLAQFVADVTVPDGWPVDPGMALQKTWRLKNLGTCTWSKYYKLVFVGGTQMGGISGLNISKAVATGQTIDLTIGLTAPTEPGTYIGYWELQNASGGLFGLSPAGTKPFFVEIEVVSKAPPAFDFVANAPLAKWQTEVTPGYLPFPGVYGDPNGYVMTVDHPILENGIESTKPGILEAPPFEYNEHIYGSFPAYEVKQGDRFEALVGCEYGAKDCDVTFVLQYQKPEGGGTRTFWNGLKSYKNSFTKVSLKIGSLAGQKVSFILLIRPNGTSTGDKAIWVNPVIVNTNTPGPQVPTVTPIPQPTEPPVVSTVPPFTGCNRATFVSDVTVPDGTIFAPGQTFTKTWRFRNTGKCTWTTGYSLVFSTGDQMGGPASFNLPSAVAPGATIDISVNLTAPVAEGSYRGYWFFNDASGKPFGVGIQGNRPFWLAVNVSGKLPPTVENGYDFAAHACDAQWMSGGGNLGCPDQSPSNGTILIVNNPRLENNTVDTRPALLMVPQNIYNGYIQGIFPPFTVQNGDHFKSIVDCEYLQRSCYAVFRLDYQIDNGPLQNLWSFGERYDGLYYQADIDLSSLAGKTVKFILRVDANGSPTGDRAMWVGPGIVRSGGVVTVSTSTATIAPVVLNPAITSTPAPVIPTNTPAPAFTATVPPPVNTGQTTYTNQFYGFQFSYPTDAVLGLSQNSYARINLPFISGTNLVEKYLEVTVFENKSPCTSSLANGTSTSQPVTGLNGIQFVKESGVDSVVGQTYDWVAYSTIKGTACISMNFVLHSSNSLTPAYNKDVESAVFSDIISTFGLTTP